MENKIKYKGVEIVRQTVTDYFEIFSEDCEGSRFGSREISANDLIQILEKAKKEFGEKVELSIDFRGEEDSDYGDASASFCISAIKRRLQTDKEFSKYVEKRKKEIDVDERQKEILDQKMKEEKAKRIKAAQELLRKEGLL